MALPPVAQLRQLIGDCFDQDELRTLCTDLDVDYDSLAGEGKAARVRELIEFLARRNQLHVLVEYCAEQRKQHDWSHYVVAIKTDPSQFVPDTVEGIERPLTESGTPGLAGGNIVLNANRALKMGFAAGVLVVGLFACGLTSGLLASRVISLNPIPVSQQARAEGQQKIQNLKQKAIVVRNIEQAQQIAAASAALPKPSSNAAPPEPSAGQSENILPASSTLNLDSEEATSLAAGLINQPASNAQMRDIHVRFEQDQVVVTFRQARSGQQRAVAYTVQAREGRLVLVPQSAWVHLIEIQNSAIGWFPTPVSAVSETTTWIQQSVNQSIKDSNLYITHISVRLNQLTLAGVNIRPRA